MKKEDFIEIEYTGKTAEEGIVFDTTDKKIAEENGLDSPNARYGPAIVCLGEGQLLPGLDKQLIGKEVGKYTLSIPAVEGFGKKDAKLVQLISTQKFKKQGITPVPGMQVEVDNMHGVIKTVTGGRTMVDFNHPLSSKDLTYHVEVKRVVTDDKEKADSLITLMFGSADTKLEDGTYEIKFKAKLPVEITKQIEERIKKLVKGVKKVVFTSTA